MVEPKDKLARLKERIEAQNGTVLEGVVGEMEIADTDAEGKPRKGPVLVLNSIEKGAVLRLAEPRPIVVLGSVYGQIFGAYQVKTGNLLSGGLNGVRHVEVLQKLGSLANSDEPASLVLSLTGDPGLLGTARRSLERLEVLERERTPLREALARTALLHAVKSATFDIRVYISVGGKLKPVLLIFPSRKDREIEIDLKALLRYLLTKMDERTVAVDSLQFLKETLGQTVGESLRLASSCGMGAALRQQRGEELYAPYVTALKEYLMPKLVDLWFRITHNYNQGIVGRLAAEPITIEVKGAICPSFCLEYPHEKFYVSGSEVHSEKIAACSVVCQPGGSDEHLRLAYTYAGEGDPFTAERDFSYAEMKGRSLILKAGCVYFNGDEAPIFAPGIEEEA